MTKHSLCVIPQPKQVSWRDGTFGLDDQTLILLLPDTDTPAKDPAMQAAELRSAQRLQREILEATGLRLPIAKMARPARTTNIILLASDRGRAATLLGEHTSWPEALESKGEQAYFVDISPARVIAGGQGPVAVHHAVATLRQVARIERSTWPALRLIDWPALTYRGLMLDVSRGKVPTLETLKLLVDQLSLYKANVLQLYTEHTFVFPHHPRIGAESGSLDSDDILALDAYARERHVELMPNLQSFGHCAHILNLPEYMHLAESAARWSLCPTDERTYAFLDDLYADLLPSFSSRTFNVGCDETWDLGKGRSAERAQQIGTGRLYLEHILRLHALAARYGRRIQLWGDILLHYPELVGELPEDVTLLDWHYEAQEDYPSVQIFAASGRPFWVCPGTSSWNTLFPRIENANANIRTLARLGVAHGAQGLLNTDWGDNGHYQPIGQCWYGYLYGAEQAWSGGMTDDAAFDAHLGPLFFGAGGEEVVATMRALGRLNTLPGMALPNATRSIYALLDEPLVGDTADKLPPATLKDIVRVCEQAEHAFYNDIASSRDRLSLEEMAYSAHLMAYAARKVIASQQVRADLTAIAAGEASAERLRSAIDAFRALDAELVRLSQVFRGQWLRRARHAEIGITLGHLSRLRERYAAALQWLQELSTRCASEETPEIDLASYAASAQDYEILGQRFWRQWREMGLL